jgi:hypothetical protein
MVGCSMIRVSYRVPFPLDLREIAEINLRIFDSLAGFRLWDAMGSGTVRVVAVCGKCRWNE